MSKGVQLGDVGLELERRVVGFFESHSHRTHGYIPVNRYNC